MKKHWRSALVVLLIVVLAVSGYYFLEHNSKRSVAVVEQTQTTSAQKVQGEYGNQDKQITQRLKTRIISGPKKGQHRTFYNTYFQSQATTNQYYRGTKLNLNNKGTEKLVISGPKRDGVLYFSLVAIIIILILCMHLQALRPIVSATLNFVLFILMLFVTTALQNQHIFLVASITSVILTALTLLIVFGISRQTLVAFIATLGSTFGAILLSVGVLLLTNFQGIHFETINYGIQPFQMVFLSETLLGVLGTVMDETTDITASIYQLIIEKSNVTNKQMLHSGLTIGREIIGPLVNILFYIFLSALLPIIVIYLRNGNTMGFSLSRTMTLGYTQTVISAIGIVLAVPLTSFVASHLLRGEHK